MSRIFDVYDLADKSGQYPEPKKKKEKRYNFTTSAKLVYNLAGRLIGVEAKEDTVFSLFFTLDGANYDLLTNGYFYLEIYDRYHQLVAEIEEELEICTLNKTIRAQIYAGEETLPYGNYYINLKVDYNDVCYVLISENDMILSIK